MIGGPAIGGLIIARYGIVTTFLVDFASYVLSLIALLSLSHIPKPLVKTDLSTFASLKVGFRYAASRQELIGTYVVDFVAMIFGMPTALFPAIAQTHGGVKVLGLLYAAPAIGALGISLLSGWTKNIKYHGIAIALAATFWGVSIVFFVFS
jgi:hypothetical protein